MKEELKIYSQDVEPTAAFVISRLFLQAQELKKNDPYQYEDAMKRLWLTVRSFNKIAFSIRGNAPNGEGREMGCHFSIAMSNEMSRIGRFIEEEFKVDPWKDGGWNF